MPDLGTRVVNWLRTRRGILMTPIDLRSLRLAVERLRKGGVVMTGVDRPVSRDDEPIQFFDAPARMPTGHVRLALQTGARVVVACCLQDPDGKYALRLGPPLEMETTGNRAEDVRHNARRVLAIIEDMIRQAPDQWLMFVPVWPDASRG
jgi:KDO2-lipid IV(A) lauroyltransferase